MAACIKAINTIFEPQPRSKELFQKEETEPYQKLYLEKNETTLGAWQYMHTVEAAKFVNESGWH